MGPAGGYFYPDSGDAPAPAPEQVVRRTELRRAMYDLPSPSAPVPDETAIRLLERALHLAQNGERAPGGDETWTQLWSDIETFLRSRL